MNDVAQQANQPNIRLDQGQAQDQSKLFLPLALRGDAKPAPSLPTDGHNHDHSGLTWPPQPRGIGDIIDHSDAAAQRLSQTRVKERLNLLDAQVRANPLVAEALGVRATWIALIDPDAKAKAAGVPSRLVYFNRANNTTVQVLLGPPEVVLTAPAAVYQPEITEEESAEAILLARKHFAASGVAPVAARVMALRGYVIMAYPPGQQGFYNSRVVYVSFHQHDDARPEFEAWVDLSDQRVIKSQGDPW